MILSGGGTRLHHCGIKSHLIGFLIVLEKKKKKGSNNNIRRTDEAGETEKIIWAFSLGIRGKFSVLTLFLRFLPSLIQSSSLDVLALIN